jgi:hypothetical protein
MSHWNSPFRHPNKPALLKNDLQVFLIALGFCVACLIVVVQPLDGDTWWHLRLGEVTFAQKRPLAIDVFSYTRFGESYLSHSWLTDLSLYLIYKSVGFFGLSAWIGVLAISALFLIYEQMEGPRVYRMCLVLITALLLLPFLKSRPQMISLTFLLGEALILHACLKGKRDHSLWLIPLFIVWSNLHGGFIIGLFYFVLFITGNLLEDVFGRSQSDRPGKGKRQRLLIVFFLCLAAVMIHPLGYNVWRTLANTMNTSTGSNMIVEWSSPNFHDPTQQVYLWWLMAILVLACLSDRRLTFVDILSLVSFTIIGFIWRRNLSFLVVFGAITVSKLLWGIMTTFWDHISGRVVTCIKETIGSIRETMELPAPKITKWVFLAVIAVVFAGSLLKLYLITTPGQVERRENQLFPYAAMTWIEHNHPEGRMMNSYNWGGYFEWKLRDYPVFLDSRADLFGDEIIGQWLDVMNAREGWQGILDRWSVNLIVIEPGWHVVDILPYHDWEELYRDEQAVIFGRSGINKNLN